MNLEITAKFVEAPLPVICAECGEEVSTCKIKDCYTLYGGCDRRTCDGGNCPPEKMIPVCNSCANFALQNQVMETCSACGCSELPGRVQDGVCEQCSEAVEAGEEIEREATGGDRLPCSTFRSTSYPYRILPPGNVFPFRL